MPVLEALASGIPCAVSAIEPIKGIAGGAALQFDPHDEEQIAASLLRVISDRELRARLCAAGPLRAADFSWRTAAQQTIRVMEAAAK